MQSIYRLNFNRLVFIRSRLLQTTAVAAVLTGLAGAGMAQDVTSENNTVLAPVLVTGEKPSEKKPDSATITAKGSSVATKSDVPLIETPRSVSVVTEKELEERGAQNIVEAIRYSAGITSGSYGFDPRFDQVYIRGYDTTTVGDYRDGLQQPYMNYGMFRTDPYELERVEVIKGPASALYGAGSPAGLVNKVSKLPTEDPIHEVGISYSTANRPEAVFDFGGPINSDSNEYLYRLVGVARHGDTNFDIADDRYLLMPSFTWQPSDQTSLTLYGLVQADETDANVGAMTGPDGQILHIRDGDPDYDYQKVRQQQVGYKFEHEFDNGLTFRQNTRFSHMDLRARYLSVWDWSGNVANRYASSIRDEMYVFQVDSQLEAKFDTGPLAHTTVFGVDVNNVNSDWGYGFDSVDPAYAFDLDNPTYGISGPTPAYNYTMQRADMRQVSLYALDQIELDQWRFNLGGRQTWVEQTRTTYSGSGDDEDQNKHAFTVQAGAVYLFDNGVAPFASYATSFNPVTQKSATNGILDPSEGEQFELGVKYQPPGTGIFLSAVAYHIVESKRPVVVDPNLGLYESLGEVTSKGIELEAKAELTDGLSVIAAYAYNDSEITRNDENVGNTPGVTPHNIASLWANYQFQEASALNGLTLGGGVRYLGENYTSAENTDKNSSQLLFDASVSYDFGAVNPDYKGLTAAFSIRNIADKVATICNDGYCYLGQGRNMTASLKYRW